VKQERNETLSRRERNTGRGVFNGEQPTDQKYKIRSRAVENAGAQVTPPGAVTPTARGAVTRGDPAAAAPAKTIGGAGLDGAGIGRPFTLDKVVLGRYFRR
jgi:hypothetical protein